jgi:predicted nucleic acid-binding protein
VTGRLVLDASAAIALLRNEPEAQEVGRILEVWTGQGATIIVPDQFWLEVVNSLTRRHRWTGDAVLRAIHELDQFQIRSGGFDRPLLIETLATVERYGLTAYDGLYLALAIAEDASLVTLDAALAKAAGTRAIAVHGRQGLHELPAPYGSEPRWPGYARAGAYLAQLRAEALRDYDRPSPSAVPGPRR